MELEWNLAIRGDDSNKKPLILAWEVRTKKRIPYASLAGTLCNKVSFVPEEWLNTHHRRILNVEHRGSRN